MIDVLDWQTSNIKHIKYYYFIIFLHIQHCSTLFYKNSIYTFRISNFFSLKKEMRNHWKKKAQRNYWKKKPLKKEMVFRGIFCHVAFYLQAQRLTLNTKKRSRVLSKITNSFTATNVDCLLVWLLSFDLSGLVVPARGSLPPPAEFSGSLKRTSPSTTARWQSLRGVSLFKLVSHNI